MASRFKVVMIANDDHPIPDWVSEKFREAGIDYQYHDCHTRQDLAQCAGDADVLWLQSSRKGLVVEDNMDIFVRAGMVIKCGSGTDNIDHEACTKRGIIVAHTPDDPTEPTSDHFVAMLFATVRQVVRQDRLVRRGKWDARAALPLGHFTGADLGLVGLGRIGKAIVRKLVGCQMNVRAYDPYVDAAAMATVGVQKVGLEEVLSKSQFVLIACPLTEETRGLLGERELKMMRPDAVLVNCARAAIVVQDALVKALQEDWLKAAALDLLDEHPPLPDSEILALENIVLTPHVGGYPDSYPDSLYDTVTDVIVDASRMRLPKWIVNKGVQPKWHMT